MVGVVLIAMSTFVLVALVLKTLSWEGAPPFVRIQLGVACALVVLVTVFLANIAFLAVPRMRFHVGARRFELRTVFTAKEWPTASLRARRHDARFGIRLFGTSIPGFKTGWFMVDGKKTLVHATGDSGVLLEGDTRVFLTPDDPEGMLRSLGLAGATIAPGPRPGA